MTELSVPVVFHSTTKKHHHTPTAAPKAGEIILSTLNAKYIHASLGLRYLCANMGDLEKATVIREFSINQRPIDIAEKLLADSPKIIGFGVYIWNVRQTNELIALLKTIMPSIIIVIGGPEVSYEYQDTDIYKRCDHLITGQADFAFRDLCLERLGNTNSTIPTPKLITASPPSVNQLESPYRLYTADDLANRIIYVEASRGCPFKCEFCLSALDKTATAFTLDQFLNEMQSLYDRGARQFKFVDRTFNLKVKNCIRILDFFLQRISDDLFVHFEVIPDKLPDELKEALRRFPTATLQFEVGIQSFDAKVQDTISRRQDDAKTTSNLAWLRQHTNAYLHADLIVGLPGETIDSFAAGFNKLVALNPHEIQVGLLKRLRGTSISRHTDTYQMRYSPDAPYQLLCNRDLDFHTLQQLQRFARYWDLIANSSRFTHALTYLLANDPFARFRALSTWIYDHSGQTHRISMLNLFKFIYQGAIELELCDSEDLRIALHADYLASGERRAPQWLTEKPEAADSTRKTSANLNARQSRHTTAGAGRAESF